MQLFLREDLFKANGGSGEPPKPPAPATPAAPAAPASGGAGFTMTTPSGGGDAAAPGTGGQGAPMSGPESQLGGAAPAPGGDVQYQPCSLNGGPDCAAAGGSGAIDAKHKVGGATEQKHAEWKAKQGAGAPQAETAAPESEMSPEQAQQKAQEAAGSEQRVAPQGQVGVTSTNPADYPINSDPFDHYSIAAAQAGDNDKSREIAAGHGKIAKDRSKDFSPEEHDQLSQKLREAGMHEDADHHQKTAGEARAVQDERMDEEKAAAGEQEGADIRDLKDTSRGKAKTGTEYWNQQKKRDVDRAARISEGMSDKELQRRIDTESTAGMRTKGKPSALHGHLKKIQRERGKEAAAGGGAPEKAARLGEDFDTMMKETKDEPDATEAARGAAAGAGPEMEQQKEARQKLGEDLVAERKQLHEDDPHTAAVTDWEEKKQDDEALYEGKVEDHKAKVDEKHASDTEAHKAKVDEAHANATEEHKTQTAADKEKHAKALEDHKAKVDEKHDAAHEEWSGKDKERQAWEDLREEHKQRKPTPPEPVGASPQGTDHDLTNPDQAKKFDKAKKDHKEAKLKFNKDKAKHQSQAHAHKAEGIALNKQRPPVSGNEPKHPGHKKGAPKPPKKTAAPKHPGHKKGAPKHPGHKKGAPEKPKHPDQPKAEDFEMKKPSEPSEKAAHAEYTQSAKTARENIQTHLENNPDLSPEEKQKLTDAHTALEGHASAERMPTKEQSTEAKKMGQVAGKHGKAAYEPPQTEAEEVPRAPESDVEKVQHADHKAKATEMRDNIQSHLDAIKNDDSLSPEQKSTQTERLTQIHQTLEAHTQLEHMPTGDQAAEMKELTKLAGEHGKKPFQEEGGEAGEGAIAAKQATAPKGRAVDLAAKFKGGFHTGQGISEAARTAEGTGKLAPQALGLAAGGVVSAGENLLHKPAARAIEQRRKQGALDEKAQMAEQKKQSADATKEATVKGLYLDLDADLDLIKAVSSPNAGTVTESGKRMQRKTKESYAKHPVGVMGGSGVAMEDDPDVGAQWHHDEADSVDTELEEEVRNQEEEPEEEEATKSVAVILLKSLRTVAEDETSRHIHNPTEVVFMRDVLGYTVQDIRKGLASITGRDRHRFHEWMLDRMSTSVDSMMGSVNLG